MTDEERVRDLLGQAFAVDPPPERGVTAQRVGAAHRRRQSAMAGVAAVATALVVGGVLIAPGLVRGSGHARTSTGAPPSPTAAASLTPSVTASVTPAKFAVPSVATSPVLLPPRPLADGDLVGANGGVLAIPGKPVRWCPNGFESDFSGVAYVNGHRPAPPWCALGVDVTGVDLDRLSLRQTSKGVVWGYAYLRGTWLHGTVAVTLQTEQRLDQPASPSWTKPPCPESAVGSLPVGPATNPDAVETLIQSWGAKHPGEIVTTVQYRPTPHRAVMVVAAEHPHLVRASLHLKASELCVVQAKFSKAEVDAAQAPFETSMRAKNGGDLLVTQLGQTVDEQGQPSVRVQVAWWTPALAASPPSAAVHVSAWLSPIAADAPLPPPIPTPTASPSTLSTATSAGPSS